MYVGTIQTTDKSKTIKLYFLIHLAIRKATNVPIKEITAANKKEIKRL
jgi:hypothetical protein